MPSQTGGRERMVVEMQQGYPFGELKEPANSECKVVVRKKLVYRTSAELDIIKKMVGLLNTLTNDHLIQLEHFQLADDETIFFYYEYAPLTLQKWILDIGDDIIKELELEMLTLASYLTQHNIKFHFDPNCFGLSKSIKVKYFLHEFMIDGDRMNNYKEVEAEIVAFFREFKVSDEKNAETATDYSDRKSADSCLLLSRLELLNSSVRDSLESRRSLASITSKKNLMLSEKIENSKKKITEILMKLKNMKPHDQQ